MDKYKETLREMLKFFVIGFTTCSIVWIIRAKVLNIELIPTIHFTYILVLSVIGAILERIFLSPKILKQLSYRKRGFLFLFFICVIIFTTAIKAHFFQPSVKEILIRFIIAYSLSCATLVLIDKFLTKEGEKYTEILNEYKKKNKLT